MPAGVAMTEAHLRRLKIAGIESVTIGNSGGAPTENAVGVQARLQALEERFAGIRDTLLLEVKKLAGACLHAMLPASNVPR